MIIPLLQYNYDVCIGATNLKLNCSIVLHFIMPGTTRRAVTYRKKTTEIITCTFFVLNIFITKTACNIRTYRALYKMMCVWHQRVKTFKKKNWQHRIRMWIIFRSLYLTSINNAYVKRPTKLEVLYFHSNKLTENSTALVRAGPEFSQYFLWFLFYRKNAPAGPVFPKFLMGDSVNIFKRNVKTEDRLERVHFHKTQSVTIPFECKRHHTASKH